jgi:hypothetical protein
MRVEQGRSRFAIDIGAHGKLPAWWGPLLRGLRELLLLEENWNSYGAKRVAPAAIVAALVLVDRTMGSTTPAPAVVPTVRGGVQLEWHVGSADLEVAVSPEGRYSVFFADAATDTEWERDFGSPPEHVREILNRFSR